MMYSEWPKVASGTFYGQKTTGRQGLKFLEKRPKSTERRPNRAPPPGTLPSTLVNSRPLPEHRRRNVDLSNFLPFLLDILLSISTNRPPLPHSRVGWLRPITEDHFYALNQNYFWKLPRDQPTRLGGTVGRLVDISQHKVHRSICYIFRPIKTCQHIERSVNK